MRARLGAHPGGLVAAAGLLLIAACARWVAVDKQVPDFDSAKHLLFAWAYSDAIERGDLAEPLTAFTEYPPLVHFVGAIGTSIGGVAVASPILATAIVFGPLLVTGLYRAGLLVGSRTTALLAVAFGLGTPMVVTMFRAFILEAAATALLAVAVWMLIASRRFEDVRWSAGAGAVVGLGMLSKQTFGFFVIGILVVLVLRGGWRNWRGMLVFAGVALALGAPWYVGHWTELRATSEWARGPNVAGPILGAKNVAWYGWTFLNHHFMLPLAVLAAVGTGVSSVRWVRERRSDDYTPELLAGALGAWIALTFYLHLKSPYYALPITVYAALLGTAWLGRLEPRRLRPAALAVVVVAGFNFMAAAFLLGDPVAVKLPRASTASPNSARSVTIALSNAWPPALDAGSNGDLLGLMHRLKRNGVERLEFDVGVDRGYFNATGLTAFSHIAGLQRPPMYDPGALRAPRDAFMGLLDEGVPGPAVCARLPEGSGVYVTLGPPGEGRSFCPREASR